MNKVIKFAGFSVAVLVVAGGAYQFYGTDKSGIRKAIPPQVNADGTIDYTLIPKGMTADEAQWVLRFPKELNVVLPENGPKELNPADFGKTPYDIALAKHLRIPNLSLSFNISASEENLKSGLNTANTADIVYVGIMGEVLTKERVNRSNQELFTNSCQLGEESFPRVFRLIEKMSNQKSSYSECGDDVRNEYILFDIAGFPYANFYCYTEKPPECAGRFWLSQNRHVYLTFQSNNIGKIQSIYKKITDEINKSTVKITKQGQGADVN